MESYEFDRPVERLEFTGERYTPDAGDKIEHEHYHRYLFALGFCTGKRVVDVACGEGYGAALLGKVAAEVAGVDSSAETIDYATRTYGSPTVVFHAADAAATPIVDGWADVVVSFETIEHLADQASFLAEVARILRPDGLLVLSTPDREAAAPEAEANPFHVRELDRAELAALLGAHFARHVVGGQRSDVGSSIAFPATGAEPTFFDRTGPGSFKSAAELPAPAYLLALATNGELPETGSSSLLDAGYLPQLHVAYHASLDELWGQVSARDERLQKLAGDVQKLEDDVQATRAELLAARVREGELGAEVAALTSRAASLTAERDRAQSALATAKAEIAALQIRAQEAERDVGSLSVQIVSLRTELAEAHESLSWRLTAPFRAAGRRFGRQRPASVVEYPHPQRFEPTPFEHLPVEHEPAVTEHLIEFADEVELAPQITDASIIHGAAVWADSTAAARQVERLAYRPLISILLPAYDTPPELLRAAIGSVLAQSYPDWELIVVDDGSTVPGFDELLEQVAAWDERIRVERRGANGGISAATNTALELATGEFVAMLDHDDELHADALFEVVRALDGDRGLDVVYTDQEYLETDGSTGEPLLKPDWSPTLFCGVMYVGHLLTVRRELALAAGGFDPAFDNVQDFEFMLRLSERTDRIAHVPRILYRWRRVPGSVAFHGDEKSDIAALQAAAVTAHLARVGVPARARPHPRHAHRAELVPLEGEDVTVSVVVVLPAGERLDRRWLDGLQARSGATIAQVVVCGAEPGNGSSPARSLREATTGLEPALLLTIEHGVVPDSDGWIASLALHARSPDVAAVAPVVLGPAGPLVSDAGVIVGVGGDYEIAMGGWDSTGDGYAGSLSCAREVSAVSGTCALISVAALEELGGFSDLFANPALAWLDLSLRARDVGRRNIVTPLSVVRAAGDRAMPDPLDRWLLRDTRAAAIAGPDPYHNPNFKPVPGGYGQ